MKNARKYILIVIFTLVSFTAYAAANDAPISSEMSAILAGAGGSVEMKPSAGKSVWVAGRANTALVPGDIIRAGEKSFAIIHINAPTGKTVIELRENSQITIVKLIRASASGRYATILSLDAGEASVNTRDPEQRSVIRIKTPTSIIAAQGGNSSFTVKVEKTE